MDQSTLKKFLDYDPDTGVFTRRIKRGKHPKGSISGSTWSTQTGRYTAVTVDGRRYYAHRLAFLYMLGRWPDEEVDHIDHDGTNNAWSNLREASVQNNRRYTRRTSRNGSGYKGVHFSKQLGKYVAKINVDGKIVHLGVFEDPQKGHLEYQKAAYKYFGEYACTA